LEVSRLTDELTEYPAQVDVGGQERSEWNGRDFGSVCGGDCLESSPRDAAQNFTNQKHLNVDSKERDEDEADLKS
jgi:hypothetical protein